MANKSKELLLDNNNMLYNQNQQIENIVTTLAQTNQTAAVVQEKLNDQGQKIQNIANTVKKFKNLKRTKIFKEKPEEREFYMKLILYIIAILLFAANIIVLALKLKN